jgi:hypothetical protein
MGRTLIHSGGNSQWQVKPSGNGEFRGGIMLGFDGKGNFVRAVDLSYLLDVLKRKPEVSPRYKPSQKPTDPEVKTKQPWEP